MTIRVVKKLLLFVANSRDSAAEVEQSIGWLGLVDAWVPTGIGCLIDSETLGRSKTKVVCSQLGGHA